MPIHQRFWQALTQPSGSQWIVCGILLLVMVLLELGGDAMRLQWRYEAPLVANGHWYRMLTGHFVHLGINHLVLNLAGILLFFYLFIKTISALEITITVLVYALGISLALHLSGDVYWYVGFSGVLYGLFVYGVIRDPMATVASRWLMVLLIIAKVLYDVLLGGDPTLAEFTGGSVIAQAHLYGIVIALVHSALRWLYIVKTNHINSSDKGSSYD
jgi:rhomboid family GlyGly-CTERM serine protease